MGKTFTSVMLSKGYDDIIILSPLRSYAKQLLDTFKKSYPNHHPNLITMDGCRETCEILQKRKNNNCNIYSSTYCSASIINDILDQMETKKIMLIVDEFHNFTIYHLQT